MILLRSWCHWMPQKLLLTWPITIPFSAITNSTANGFLITQSNLGMVWKKYLIPEKAGIWTKWLALTLLTLFSCQGLHQTEEPQVTFLGTGSAMPSKYRNGKLHLQPSLFFVYFFFFFTLCWLRFFSPDYLLLDSVTSIYVSIPSYGGFFFDTGEGTLGQLTRRFGVAQTEQVTNFGTLLPAQLSDGPSNLLTYNFSIISARCCLIFSAFSFHTCTQTTI